MFELEGNLVFFIFFGVWVVLAAGSFVFFYLGKNGRLKRILWPVNILLAGIIFVLFVLFVLKLPSNITTILIPMIVLISVMNLYLVQFCLSCGHMVMSQNPFVRPKQCPKCNTALKKGEDT